MFRTLTAADRASLIRLASSLPVGSPERRAILAGMMTELPRVSQSKVVYVDVYGGEVGIRMERRSPDQVVLRHGDKQMQLFDIGGGKWEELQDGAWVQDFKSLDEAVKRFAEVVR